MTVFALAFVIGVLNGLRSFTPPAAAPWAAHLRWIKLQGPLALMGSVPAVAIFTLLAAFELFADKKPWIPDRITALSLVLRGVMGALTGACVAAAGGLLRLPTRVLCLRPVCVWQVRGSCASSGF